jgi:hypothetical protein
MIHKNLIDLCQWTVENKEVSPALIDAFIEAGYPYITDRHFRGVGRIGNVICDHTCLCIDYVLANNEQRLNQMELMGERTPGYPT